LRDNGLGAKCKTPLPFPSAGKLLIFCGHAGEQFGRGLLKTIPLSRSHQTRNPRRGLARAYKACCTMFGSGWLPDLFCSVEQLDWREGLDSGNGLLVDDLRLAISREQNAEAVEGGHVALELDAVCKNHRHSDLVVLKMPEEPPIMVSLSLYDALERWARSSIRCSTRWTASSACARASRASSNRAWPRSVTAHTSIWRSAIDVHQRPRNSSIVSLWLRPACQNPVLIWYQKVPSGVKPITQVKNTL